MRLAWLVSLSLVAASCSPTAGTERSYRLQGQIQSIDSPKKIVVVKHEEVKGFMPAMTMPYEVAEPGDLDGLAPGDLIDATLVVFSNGAHLKAIKKVGQAPLENVPLDKPSAEGQAFRAPPVIEVLKPGEAVPDARFVDQNGRKRRFHDFTGSPLVVTFIYTRCPLPTFCPLMDRHFAAMQAPLTQDPAFKRVRLVTISFDPAADTPPVLMAHARQLKADLGRWTFLTGDRDEIDRFASRFGVSVSRAANDPRDITHNLRTAIIDGSGRLVKVYTGNDWTPDQVLADLKATGIGG
jgi:protein SCO1/2